MASPPDSANPMQIKGSGTFKCAGTETAIYSNCSKPEPPNHRNRSSLYIKPKNASNLLAACLYAYKMGMGLNRFVTINWDYAGLSENSPRPTSYFLKRASERCRRDGIQFCYAWVREVGHVHGHHTHLLMHVSPSYVKDFSRHQRSWITAQGGKCTKGAIKTKCIGRSYSHFEHGVQYGEHYLDHLNNLAQYILKGTEPDGDYKGQSFQGNIVGKRIGFSQNIGPKARSGMDNFLTLVRARYIAINSVITSALSSFP